MTITLTCPRCGKQHGVGEEMAGTRASCACGEILIIPRPAQAASTAGESILVQCPSCSRRYGAKPSLMGKITRCSCGATIAIPAASPPSRPVPSRPVPNRPVPGAVPSSYPGRPTVSGPGAVPPPRSPSVFDEMLAGSYPAASGPASVLAPLPRRRKPNSLLFYGWVVLGTVLGLGLTVIVVMSLSGGGSSGPPPAMTGPLGSTSWCIPPNAQTIVSGDIEKLAQNGLLQLALTLVRTGAPSGGRTSSSSGMSANTLVPPPTAQLFVQSLAEFQLAVTGDGNPILILVTKGDMELENASYTILPLIRPSAALPPETRHIGSIQYVKMRNSKSLMAKIAPNTFCIADREQDLREALARRQRGEVSPLSSSLRRAWESTHGDLRAAESASAESQSGLSLSLPGMAPASAENMPRSTSTPRPQWVGVGITLGSDAGLRVTAGFLSNADAQGVAQGFNARMQTAEAQVGEMEGQLSTLPPAKQAEIQPMIERMRKWMALVRKMQISQNGDTLQISGTWAVRDLQDLIQQVQALQGRSGSGAR